MLELVPRKTKSQLIAPRHVRPGIVLARRRRTQQEEGHGRLALEGLYLPREPQWQHDEHRVSADPPHLGGGCCTDIRTSWVRLKVMFSGGARKPDARSSPAGTMKASRRQSSSQRSTKRLQASYKLTVHGPEYGTGEELVINPEAFPDAKVLRRHDVVANPHLLHVGA